MKTLLLSLLMIASTMFCPVAWSKNNTVALGVSADSLRTGMQSFPFREVVDSLTDASMVKASCAVMRSHILITHIEITPIAFAAKVGCTVQVGVIIIPANATDKSIEWSSDDESVAVVNAKGDVTIKSEGSTVIRVRTLDGSNLEAICYVSSLSGIDGNLSDELDVDIYTISGILIMKAAKTDTIRTLQPGIYIIRQGDNIYKIKL